MSSQSKAERKRATRHYVLLGLGSLLIAGAFFVVLEAGALPVIPEHLGLSTFEAVPLITFSVVWIVILLLKALRWRWQLLPIAPVGTRRVIAASLLGFAALLLFPLRSGEFVRPALISRGTKVPFFAAVSTSATERIIDSVFASAILIVSLASAEVLSPLPDQIGDLPVPTKIVPTLGYTAAAASIVAVCIALSFFYFRDLAGRVIQSTLGKFWPRGGAWLERSLSEFARGLTFLAMPRYALPYVAVSAAYWALYWFDTWYLLKHSGFPEASFVQAGVVSGTLAFGLSLPNAPGFFGSFQLAVYASLALFFSSEAVQGQGAVSVFWLYVLQIGWVFALAPFAAWSEHRSRKTARDAQAAAEAS